VGDFSRIREAYDYLMDEDKRYVLDRWGDIGVTMYGLFEQQRQQQNEHDQTEVKQKHTVRIRDQIEVLLSWYGIRLHSFLFGLAAFSLAAFFVSCYEDCRFSCYFLLFSNLVSQVLIIIQSLRDLQAVFILVVFFVILDAWQYALFYKVNYLITILPLVFLIQLIGIIINGFHPWYQTLSTSISAVLLCFRLNQFFVLPYPVIFLPILVSRLVGTEPKKVVKISLVFAVMTTALHVPVLVLGSLTLLFALVGLFLSLAVPLGHYYIIRLIMAHLTESRSGRISGLITPS
jgi:hypothetical protein